MKKSELPKETIEWLNDLAAHNVHYSYHTVLGEIARLPEEHREEVSKLFHAIHEKRQDRRRKETIKANTRLLKQHLK